MCWGQDVYGETQVPDVGPFLDISTGNLATCGILTDASLVCWGNAPDLEDLDRYRDVSVGLGTVCAVRVDGTLQCWGDDTWGQASPP